MLSLPGLKFARATISNGRRIVVYMSARAGGGVGGMSGKLEIVTATAAALIFGFVFSWGAVYGLNRYLGPPADPYETTGGARIPDQSD
jgi:hypothetical protein